MYPVNDDAAGLDSASAKSKSYPLLVHLPVDLMQEVDELCEGNNMTRSEFIKIALNLYLEKFGEGYITMPPSFVRRRSESDAADDDDEPGLLAAAEDEE